MKKILGEAVAVSQRHLAQLVHESARSELVLLSRVLLGESAVRWWLRLPAAAPDGDQGGRQAVPPDGRPATGSATTLFLRPPVSPRRWGCDYPESARSTSPRCPTPTRTRSTAASPTGWRCQGIPEAEFWSLTLYDNQTRSMLDTPQRFPRAGSQSYPTPAADADRAGATTVYRGPSTRWRAHGQLDPDAARKGWFAILRLYGPTEPFFDKAGARARSNWSNEPIVTAD